MGWAGWGKGSGAGACAGVQQRASEEDGLRGWKHVFGHLFLPSGYVFSAAAARFWHLSFTFFPPFVAPFVCLVFALFLRFPSKTKTSAPRYQTKTATWCGQKPTKPGKSQLPLQLQAAQERSWTRGEKGQAGEQPPCKGHPGTQALSLCLFGAFGAAFLLSCFPDSCF